MFGGSLRVGVNKTGEWKAFWSKTLNPIRQRILYDHINSLISKSPGTKDPIIFSRWDDTQKKQVPEWSLELQKDEKLVYHIIVSWKGAKYDAPIRGAYGVAFVPMQMVLTNKRRDASSSDNSRGGSNSAPSTEASDDYF